MNSELETATVEAFQLEGMGETCDERIARQQAMEQNRRYQAALQAQARQEAAMARQQQAQARQAEAAQQRLMRQSERADVSKGRIDERFQNKVDRYNKKFGMSDFEDGLGALPENNRALGVAGIALLALGAYLLFGKGKRKSDSRLVRQFDIQRLSTSKTGRMTKADKRLRSKFRSGLGAAAKQYGGRRVRTAQQDWDEIEREEA